VILIWKAHDALMTHTNPTAARTWTDGKATITVTFADGTTQTVGGARAARAAAVLVVDQGGKPPKVMCRASVADAEGEAARRSSGAPIKTQYGTVPSTPEPTAVVLITEA
jgi:hypothetical protein